MEYKYIFSVIMPVYNCEPYIREAIDSVLNQHEIAGGNSVQIILIDDNSNDGCFEICDEYAQEHNNVFVVHNVERLGASYSRNIGLQMAEGKYFFLDADDFYSLKTLSQVFSFFEEYYEEIDVVAIPEKIIGIEKEKVAPTINNTLSKNTILILSEKDADCDISATNAFFKSASIVNIKFDENLKYGEDKKFFLETVLKKRTLGVVTKAKYCFRIRESGENSLTQDAPNDPLWYSDYLEKYPLYFVDKLISEHGFLPPFVQLTLFSSICSKLTTAKDIYQLLGNKNAEVYKNMLARFLQHINDKFIMNCNRIFIEHKFYCMRIKYQLLNLIPMIEPIKNHTANDALVLVAGIKICRLSKNMTKIDFIDLNKNQIVIEGFTALLPVCDFDVVLNVESEDGHKYTVPCEYINRNTSKYLNGEEILKGKSFVGKFQITDDAIEKYQIGICCVLSNGMVVDKNEFRFGKMCSIGKEYNNEYILNMVWQ